MSHLLDAVYRPSATDRVGRSLPAASIPPSHPTQAPDPAGAPPLGGR